MTEKIKANRNELLLLMLAAVGVFGGIVTVNIFNKSVFVKLPIAARMPLIFLLEWVLMLVPAMIMILRDESLGEFLPKKEKLGRQILTGLGIAAVMSVVMTLVPHLAGFGKYVESGYFYTEPWQYIFYFFQCVFAIALTEEFIFRGYFYSRIDRIFGETAAIAGSSVLFGLFHVMSGNIVQLFVTGLLGAVWCICRKKIPHCTLLSLIIAHGVYDFMIMVWQFVFTK